MIEKYVNVAFNAYGETTVYLCDLQDIKTGDFVIVPTLSGTNVGRVMSCTPKRVFSLSLAKTRSVLRKANPVEINEVADLYGIKKNPDLGSDEEDDSFLTNNGYGTKELNRMMKKLQDKQTSKEDRYTAKMEKAQQNVKANTVIKNDSALPIYWRYVALVILILYFLKDYIFD